MTHTRVHRVIGKVSHTSLHGPGQRLTLEPTGPRQGLTVAAVLTINQTYNNLGLYDSVADSQMLLLNNQSIVQLEVHLL